MSHDNFTLETAIEKFHLVWAIAFLFCSLFVAGCSSLNEYGTGEIHWGGYGTAWRCDPLYINKPADTGTGIAHDATDLVFRPLELVINTATFRFLWGTNGVVNYFLGFFSILPTYSHCDAAFWYDFGLKSLDKGAESKDENNEEIRKDEEGKTPQ